MRKQIAVVALLFLGSMGCTDDAAESDPLIVLDDENNVVAADNNMQVEPTPPQYYSARLAGVLAGLAERVRPDLQPNHRSPNRALSHRHPVLPLVFG